MSFICAGSMATHASVVPQDISAVNIQLARVGALVLSVSMIFALCFVSSL
jgi:hypothetical protein